jgi:hypothetical protein
MILRYFKLAMAVVLLTLTAFSSLHSQSESSPLSHSHYDIPKDINTVNMPLVLDCVLEESINYTLVNRLYEKARMEVDICPVNADRYDICIDKQLENFNSSSIYRRIKPLKPSLIFMKVSLSFFALAFFSLTTTNLFTQTIFTVAKSADLFYPVKRKNGLPAACDETNFPLRFMAEITSVKSLIFKSKTTKSHQQQKHAYYKNL